MPWISFRARVSEAVLVFDFTFSDFVVRFLARFWVADDDGFEYEHEHEYEYERKVA